MRRLLALVALVCGLGLLGAAPALADDIPPPVFPSGLPGPDDVPGGGTVSSTPGPTYVVTPGSPGSALPPPVPRTAAGRPARPTQAQVDEARKALQRNQGNRVAGPVAPARAPAAQRGTDWWLIGSGAFLGLVLIEARRVTGTVTRDVASR